MSTLEVMVGQGYMHEKSPWFLQWRNKSDLQTYLIIIASVKIK